MGGLVPITSNLLDDSVPYDGSERRRAREQRVREAWFRRRELGPVAIEEWFSELQSDDTMIFHYLQSLIAHRIAFAMAARTYPRLHNGSTGIYRATGSAVQEKLWSALLSFDDLCVVTTNYDIVAERGLRALPTRRRPGFNYGVPGELLCGRTWPANLPVHLNGAVPIHKLHGSISWERVSGGVTKWVDCRNAVKGSAFIVPPVSNKPARPGGLEDVWERAESALRSARRLIVIGYSAPRYDLAVRSLLGSVPSDCSVHVFDLNPAVRDVYEKLLPHCRVTAHGALPESMPDLIELSNAR